MPIASHGWAGPVEFATSVSGWALFGGPFVVQGEEAFEDVVVGEVVGPGWSSTIREARELLQASS